MERKIIATEEVEYVDGSKKTISIRCISGYDENRLVTKHTTYTTESGRPIPRTDYSEMIHDMIVLLIGEDNDVKNLTSESYNMLEMKYLSKDTQEHKEKKESSH